MAPSQTVIGLVAGLARLISGVNARWLDCPPTTEQRIYFANHSSHLDALVLWASLPAQVRMLTRPAAARDYWGTTALRRYVAEKILNAVLIERPGKSGESSAVHQGKLALKTIDDMLEAMGESHSLILFPEGTRGDGTEIAPFKGGMYRLAKQRPDIKLVPVYLENLSRILPKGEMLPVPILSSASFGAPLSILADESKSDFLSRARQAIEALKS